MAVSEKRKKYLAKWREKNREKVNKQSREWVKKWRRENPKLAKAKDKKCRSKYKKKRSQYNSWYYKNRMKNDPKFKIRHILSSAISARLRKRFSGKNCKSIFNYLDFTIDDLMKHLEDNFKKGMSWKNYGKWHIDHKIADSKFNYTSPNDKIFLENLCSYS